jgi:hypothetical protein
MLPRNGVGLRRSVDRTEPEALSILKNAENGFLKVASLVSEHSPRLPGPRLVSAQ